MSSVRALAVAAAAILVLACPGPEPTPTVEPTPTPTPLPSGDPAKNSVAGQAELSTREADPAELVAPPARRAESFIDDPALSLTVAARVKTGVQPKSVAVSPDGRQLWVCNFGYSGRRNVYVYASDTLERLAVVEFAGNAVEVGFSHAGDRAYVSNFARGVVEVVDTASFALVHEVPRVGKYPKVVAVAPDDRQVYVANWGSGDVAVIDGESGRVVDRLDAGRRPRGMAVARDGTLFVNAMWDHRVDVFTDLGQPLASSARRAASAAIGTCQFPRHAALDDHPTDPALFVTCSGDDRLRWHDPRDGRVLGEVAVGDNPRSFALSEDRGMVAVANFDASSVTVVDLPGGRVHTTAVADSDRIVGLAVGRGAQLRVYATSWGDNQLLDLRLTVP